MATLVSGDTLSLNNLAGATGNTQGVNVSLGTIRGGAISTGLSSYAIDSVTGITGYTYAVEGTSENYQLTFTGEGSNFGQIKNHTPNFTWSIPVQGGYLSLGTNSGYIRTFSVSSMNPQLPSAQSSLQSIASHTIRVNFADGYNDHIGGGAGYGVNKDKTVYSVDSYDGNSTVLCLKSNTPVELADGSIIEIGDVEEGMKLKGYAIAGLEDYAENKYYDWSSDSLEATVKEVEVVNVVYSFSNKIYNINGGQIYCTSEHPFLVKRSDGTYKFKPAHLLTEEDSLLKSTKNGVIETPITSIVLEQENVEIVSIDVEEIDTYLANGYITHNKGGNSHADFDGPTAPTSVSYTHPTLSWSGGVADTNSGGISGYDVQISTSATFATLTKDQVNWDVTTMQLAGGFVPAGSYYARVRNVQSGLKSTWTQIGPFSVVL